MSLPQEVNTVGQAHMMIDFLDKLQQTNFFESKIFKDMQLCSPSYKEFLSTAKFDNQGYLILSLYSYLVLPKALFGSKYHSNFNAIDKYIDSIKLRADPIYKDDRDGVKYLKHIRNSIAHGQIEFPEDEDVIKGIAIKTKCARFTDINNNTKEKCVVELPISELRTLIGKLEQIIIEFIHNAQQPT